MSIILNVFKSSYYQVVDFIQQLSDLWFATIWLCLLAGILFLIANFYKKYNGEQKKFEKISWFILAILLIAVLVFITKVRN